MNPLTVKNFVETTLGDASSPWDLDLLSKIANTNVPELAYGGAYLYSKSDINFLWASWIIESYCDSERLISSDNWSRVFKIVVSGFQEIHGEKDCEDVLKAAKLISDIIYDRILSARGRSRKPITKATKLSLINSSSSPRCWYCGYKFCDDAVESFLSSCKKINLPPYVDYLTGRGLIERHLKIEVDHIIPFSKGGADSIHEDNLKITCGWCNSYKSNNISIYGVRSKNIRYNHKIKGLLSIPNPFWCIRAFGVLRRCSYHGCTAKNSHAELFISPRNLNGVLNPYNIDVRCSKHDPIQEWRLVPRETYKKNIVKSLESIF